LNTELFELINAMAGRNAVLDACGVALAQATPYVFCALLLYLWFSKRPGDEVRKSALMAGESAVLGLAVNLVIVLFYYHARPFVLGLGTQLVPHAPDSSFPSDHATFLFSIACALSAARPTRGWGIAALALAFFGSVARVFCGVHFSFDILGSIGVSAASAAVVLWLGAKGPLARLNDWAVDFYKRSFLTVFGDPDEPFHKRLAFAVDLLLRRRVAAIAALFLLAFAVRAVKPFTTDRISKDGVLYVRMARDLSSGDTDAAFERNPRMPPLYVWMMAGMARSGMDAETAGRWISIVAGALLVVPVFLIAERIFGARSAAAVSGFLVAFNPKLVSVSARVMRDSLFAFLLFAALWVLLKALDEERWRGLWLWLGCGVILLLSVAVRTEGVELLGVAAAAVALESLVSIIRRRPVGKRAVKWCCGLACMCVAYYAASLPVSAALDGTPSTWSAVDRRISSYLRGVMHVSAEDALEKEDTL